MANCGNCGCNCIVADQGGFPYPVGTDRYGNEAIIVPTPDTRCGMFEFVHGTTDCADALYPMVAPVDNIKLTGAMVVLSVPDDAPVIIGLRVNAVQVAQVTVPTGTRIIEWPATDFPLLLNQYSEVETAILYSGNVKPAVSVQFVVCVPGTVETSDPVSTDPITTLLWNPAGRGVLGAGQDPSDLGIAATAPSLAFYVGGGANPDSLWLVAADSSRTLAHRQVWPPDPSQVPSHVVGWDSGTTLIPANPVDPATIAVAVDKATNQVSHWWNTNLQGWVKLSASVSRIEMGQGGPHEPPSGPVALTFFDRAGTFRVDIVGVWELHNGSPLTVEVVDAAGLAHASIDLPAGTRSVAPSSPVTIAVPAGGALGVRCANTPPTPGSGVSLVGTYSSGS